MRARIRAADQHVGALPQPDAVRRVVVGVDRAHRPEVEVEVLRGGRLRHAGEVVETALGGDLGDEAPLESLVLRRVRGTEAVGAHPRRGPADTGLGSPRRLEQPGPHLGVGELRLLLGHAAGRAPRPSPAPSTRCSTSRGSRRCHSPPASRGRRRARRAPAPAPRGATGSRRRPPSPTRSGAGSS